MHARTNVSGLVAVVAGAAFMSMATAQEGASGPRRKAVCGFEQGTAGWVRRDYGEDGKPRTSALSTVAAKMAESGSAQWLRLPISFPDKAEFVMPLKEQWTGWQRLEAVLFLPADLPATSELYFFIKDWDHLWRQIRIPIPTERGLVRFDLPLAGDAATQRWELCGHERPWHALTSGQLLEFGCSFDLATGASDEYSGDAFLVGAWLRDPGPLREAPVVRNFGWTPHRPVVGTCCEVTFELGATYRDPFDADDLLIEAEVRRPDQTTETVRGFYFEGFHFNPAIPDNWAQLKPYGRPNLRIRYTPRVAGRHEVRIRIRVQGKEVKLPPMNFEALPAEPEYRGFVRVDATDRRYLSFDDGQVFNGIGMNVRSPFDTRYVSTAPYTLWRDEGLLLYERLFRRYAQHGINVVEVWMSSWWLALEWINDAPGFHGVGYMNQYRAWMLDQIMAWAEQYGIYVILVFNNHGKFGTTYDTEWARNPFNVQNGGFLEDCEDYFSDARAKDAFKRFVDYTVARWGHSPNILMWKLFTEIDLTGNSQAFYRLPVMSEWHQEMGAYVKEIDPYDHPITTHWMLGYHRINDEVADLPELDILTTDAYYQGGGTRQMINLFHGTAEYALRKKKPVLVTEFGGSPYADSMGNLMKQASLGAWYGFFCGSCVAPLYWWFALVDEKDLYDRYTGLEQYMAGTDRRGMTTSSEEIAEKALAVHELRDEQTVLCWGFDTEYYFSDQENLIPRRIVDYTHRLQSMAAGVYRVEYWDCRKGTVIRTESKSVSSDNSVLELHVPPFERDFALKVLRVTTEGQGDPPAK